MVIYNVCIYIGKDSFFVKMMLYSHLCVVFHAFQLKFKLCLLVSGAIWRYPVVASLSCRLTCDCPQFLNLSARGGDEKRDRHASRVHT